MQATTPRGYTSRYLSAVQAATNTVSTWLQGSGGDEIPSPVAAAAEQLLDERPFKNSHNEVRLMFVLRCQAMRPSPTWHLLSAVQSPLSTLKRCSI